MFIDRCAWSRRLGEALKLAGIPFIAHHEKFEPACLDEDWLKVAGRSGWIVLTRDKAIRRKPNELKAFRGDKVIGFALASGNASAEDTARLAPQTQLRALVTGLYPAMMRKARGCKPLAMFSVTLVGTIGTVRL